MRAERRVGELLAEMEKAKGNVGARRRGLDLQEDRYPSPEVRM